MSTTPPVPAPAPALDPAPVIRVERGSPDTEELAALTAVLLARAARAGAGAGPDQGAEGAQGGGLRMVAAWPRAHDPRPPAGRWPARPAPAWRPVLPAA
ncbi:acyl-CoA carboxylase subunit epsilon [Streptacidiphilus sp. ASG 303]|uniref:acyl-CoA carboxylase epsilon subunit n=1 Tax=Streptacidiphilus sp. ASG 303 TaxID=2896847 RepID=UPI001E461B28|nr:acyl-CoA carboxylase epsilon subunit [Streptacidiphilus sp. ASG 303]MCD0485130.1 acyl-CoA carboxylase subunit epsilon [Streptacidiphilus sp. ASG 303]